MPYSLNTASHILCTETQSDSLSSAIQTETRKIMSGVAVGEKEKLLYFRDTEYLNMVISCYFKKSIEMTKILVTYNMFLVT